MERSLREALNLPLRPRGSSDANTAIALKNVLALAEASDTQRITASARWLEKWCGQAARVLGEASAIIRLPKQPGEHERPCPFCVCFTLRYWPLHGVVRCINPGCRDDEGRRPSAKITYSSFTAHLELLWQDGVLGLPDHLPEVKK
jgi:hypothetical protein